MTMLRVLWLVIFVADGFSSDDVRLDNPSPVPLGTTAVFTCSGTGFAIGWQPENIPNSSATSDIQPGTATSRLSLPAIEENNNTAITCIIVRTMEGNLQRTENLTIYGPPSEPAGLSSELSSVAGVLVLSWSPPWTPDGVQLHYTVTVWTNTSTITMFNTSSTTITISRDNITGNTTDCDIYTFSVTAINPAGSSIPANHTSPLTAQSVPTDVQSDICISNQSNCATVNYSAFSCTRINYRLVVRDTCNDRADSREDNSGSNNIPYIMNCTNITIIANNSLGMSPNHSVNTTSPSYCTRPVLMCSIIITATSSQNPPTIPPMASITPSSETIVIIASSVAGVVALIVLLSLILIVTLICCKLKQKKGEATITSKKSESELGKMTLTPTFKGLQTNSDYMDPIDAKYQMEKFKSSNGETLHKQVSTVDQQQQPVYDAVGPISAAAGIGDTELYSSPFEPKPSEQQNALDSPLFHRKSSATPPALPSRPPSLASRSSSIPFRSPSRPPSLSSRPPSLPSRSPSRPTSFASRPPSLASHAPPLPPPLPPPSQEYAVLNHGHTRPIPPCRDQTNNYSSINRHPTRLPRESYSQLQFRRDSGHNTIQPEQTLFSC